jgi:hypothetical protein
MFKVSNKAVIPAQAGIFIGIATGFRPAPE